MTQQDSDKALADDAGQEYPILSTVDKGGRMTQLLEGRPVGQFTPRLLAHVLICVAVWTLAFTPICAAYFELALSSVGSPWAAAASLVIAYGALGATIGLYRQVRSTFGQNRVPGLLASAVVCGGFAISVGGWLLASLSIEPSPAFDLHNIATSPTFPRELLAVVGAGVGMWAIFALARLGPALNHARSRQQTIDRLRRSGTRHAGEISELEFRNAWRSRDPIFRIQVAYGAQRGSSVAAHMRTSQARIPVVGSPMVVFTDEAGSVHVDLDDHARIEFEPDDGRYAPSE